MRKIIDLTLATVFLSFTLANAETSYQGKEKQLYLYEKEDQTRITQKYTSAGELLAGAGLTLGGVMTCILSGGIACPISMSVSYAGIALAVDALNRQSSKSDENDKNGDGVLKNIYDVGAVASEGLVKEAKEIQRENSSKAARATAASE